MSNLQKLKLRSLMALDALDRAGSVTEAANILGVTQPAITLWLNELNEVLGFQAAAQDPALNARVVTERGKLILPRVHRVLYSATALLDQADPSSASIGFTRSYTGRMGSFLDKLGNTPSLNEGFRFHPVCDSSENLIREVKTGSLDAAIVLSEVFTRESPRDLCVQGEFSQQSLIYTSTRHYLAKTVERNRLLLTPEEMGMLVGHKETFWIGFARDSLREFYAAVSSFFVNEFDRSFKISLTVKDQESLYALLLADEGIAILPAAVRGYRFPGVRAFAPPQNFPRWDFCVIRHQANEHPLLTELYAALLEVGRSLH